MKKKSVFRMTFLCVFFLSIVLSCIREQTETKRVYKVSIETAKEEGVTGIMIDRGLVPYVKRVLQEATNADADAVILEIDTHGGRVDSAEKIRDAVLNTKVRTIAFIRRAISAGALIALAADDIVMSPGAAIGDAAPVQLDGTPLGEKAVSHVRAQFRATAEEKGRRTDIAEAMVDANREISGTGFKLTNKSLEGLKSDLEEKGIHKDISDKILKDLAHLENKEFTEENEFLKAVEEKIEQDQLAEHKDVILKHAKSWIVKKGELLTLTTQEALDHSIRIAEYKKASTLEEVLQTVATSIMLTSQSLESLTNEALSDKIREDLAGLKDKEFTRKTEFLNAVEEKIGQAHFDRYIEIIWKHVKKEFALASIPTDQIKNTEPDWAEQLARFLTDQYVSSLLMAFGFLGLFIEFRTPSFGLFGTIGLVCLGLFFWGHLFARLAGWEVLILFLAGIVLLLIEIFVIPGFGVVGIMGILCILTSLVLSMDVKRFDSLSWLSIQMALSKLTAALIGCIILSIVLLKFLPRTSVGKQVILQTAQKREEGYVAHPDNRSELIGMTGVTLTPLHPSGTMLLKEKRYDVVSEGDFIEKNTRVKVLSVEGARIVVRQIDEN